METDQKTAESIEGARGTCGTCAHGVRRDLQAIECFGLPPQLIATGIAQHPNGQRGMHFEKIRPVMQPGDRQCSLYKFKFAQDSKITPGAFVLTGAPPEGRQDN